MGIIPDFVIKDWEDQYNEDHDFWAEISQKFDVTFDAAERQKIREMASEDEVWYRAKYLDHVTPPVDRKP